MNSENEYFPQSPTYNPTSPDPYATKETSTQNYFINTNILQSPEYFPSIPTSADVGNSNLTQNSTYIPLPSTSKVGDEALSYLVKQHDNINFVDTKEHELMVNRARYNGLDFTRSIHASHTGSETVTSRKRIYGEEYRTLGEFDIEPRFKLIKLDQQQHEILAAKSNTANCDRSVVTSPSHEFNDSDTGKAEEDTFGRSASDEGPTINNNQKNMENYTIPTPTDRQSSVFKLTVSQIPNICMQCLSIRCYCKDL